MADDRTTAVSEFVQVLLAQDYCAGSAQPANHLGILLGNPVLEYGAGSSGAYARRVDQVLESGRHAMQGATPSPTLNLSLGLLRLRQSAVRRNRDEGIQQRIQLLDACQALPGKFERRHGSGSD